MCVRGILPRIGFLELLCEMVTERWRLSLNMCETGRRCVRGCERKRHSNLNVKECLWVITKWIAVQTKMSMVWDCGPVPIYHRMLERLHQLCEVFFNHTSCLKTVMVADQVQKSQQTSLILSPHMMPWNLLTWTVINFNFQLSSGQSYTAIIVIPKFLHQIPSLHFLPVVWARVVGAPVSAEKPRLPHPPPQRQPRDVVSPASPASAPGPPSGRTCPECILLRCLNNLKWLLSLQKRSNCT